MDKQLVALYEIKRQSFLSGYIQNPDRFSNALAFAYEHRLAPIFNERIMREVYDGDPFEDVYAVKAEFMEAVIKYVDDKWLAKDLSKIGFYDLEDKFGGHQTNRVELIYTLEYARISRLFDDNLWKAIESNAPVEANSLAATFGPEDVEFS